jgi:hypothetical protein
LLTQLLYWKALKDPGLKTRTEQKILEYFRDENDGLLNNERVYSGNSSKQYGLLETLLVVYWSFPFKYNNKYEPLLEQTTYWTRFCKKYFSNKTNYSKEIGRPMCKPYKTNSHWLVRFAGLQHYHDTMQWPWLIFFTGVVAIKCNDHDIFELVKKLEPTIPNDELWNGETWVTTPEKQFLLTIAYRQLFLRKAEDYLKV